MSPYEKIREFARERTGEWVTFDELCKVTEIKKPNIYDLILRLTKNRVSGFIFEFNIEKKSDIGNYKIVRFIKKNDSPDYPVVTLERKEPKVDLDIMQHVVIILKSQSEDIKAMREDIREIKHQVQAISKDPVTRGMLLKLEIIQEKLLEISL
jgi:hypothetical protein